MQKNRYKLGDWHATCDICGLDRYASELADDYRGLKVCRDTCLDQRNSQDFVRAKPEKAGVPWTRIGDLGEGQQDTILLETGTTTELDASLIDLVYSFEIEGPSSGVIQLPAPNNATFIVPVTYVISIVDSDGTISAAVVSTAGGTIIWKNEVGSGTIVTVGAIARFRNIPSQNVWIRDA